VLSAYSVDDGVYAVGSNCDVTLTSAEASSDWEVDGGNLRIYGLEYEASETGDVLVKNEGTLTLSGESGRLDGSKLVADNLETRSG